MVSLLDQSNYSFDIYCTVQGLNGPGPTIGFRCLVSLLLVTFCLAPYVNMICPVIVSFYLNQTIHVLVR